MRYLHELDKHIVGSKIIETSIEDSVDEPNPSSIMQKLTTRTELDLCLKQIEMKVDSIAPNHEQQFNELKRKTYAMFEKLEEDHAQREHEDVTITQELKSFE